MDKYRDTGIPRSQDTLMDTGIPRSQDTLRDTGIPRSQDTLRDTRISRTPSEIQGYRGTQGILRNIGKQGYPLPRPPSLLRKTGILEYQQGYWDTNRDIGIPGTTYRDTQRKRKDIDTHI